MPTKTALKAIAELAGPSSAAADAPNTVVIFCRSHHDATIAEAIAGAGDSPESPSTGTGPMLAVKIHDADGFEAVVNIMEWRQTSVFDTSACPAIAFPDEYEVKAVVIRGTVEYPEVNGFTWVSPIDLIGGSVDGAGVTQASEPVVVATCATPVSSPNLASSLPKLEDSAWIVPPAAEFAITILYASKLSPNNPEGRFSEMGDPQQYLSFTSVSTDCASLNTAGFTATDHGYCKLTRTTPLT